MTGGMDIFLKKSKKTKTRTKMKTDTVYEVDINVSINVGEKFERGNVRYCVLAGCVEEAVEKVKIIAKQNFKKEINFLNIVEAKIIKTGVWN